MQRPEKKASKPYQDPDEPGKITLTEDEQKKLDLLVAQKKAAQGAAPAMVALDQIDLASFPKLVNQLFLVTFFTVLVFLASWFIQTFTRDLLVHIPMQLYWTFCIYRLSQIMAKRYNSEPPMSGVEIAVISILSFVCMPVFDNYHFAPRWADPFFILWALTQVAWP